MTLWPTVRSDLHMLQFFLSELVLRIGGSIAVWEYHLFCYDFTRDSVLYEYCLLLLRFHQRITALRLFALTFVFDLTRVVQMMLLDM